MLKRMKSRTQFQKKIPWHWVSLLSAWLSASPVTAADTNAPPPAPKPLTPEQMFEGGADTYNNWIDWSFGGFFMGGNKAQFQQRHRTSNRVFGGIEDFHYQQELSKTTTFSADGRALFDNDDYKVSLGVTREKFGYLRISYDQFRTWSSGDGGFYPPSGRFYQFADDAFALDRGEISVEGGLTLEGKPKVTFKYTHAYRDGEKDSTSWGPAHPAIGVTRGISPAFRDIDERRDIFQLDVTHRIKKTDFGVGLRYESGELDNALKAIQFPGESIRQKITAREGTTYDLFNVHTFTESWIKTNVLFSSGFSYSDLDNDFSGSRIYGTDFDVGYVPSAQSGFGYYGLNGGSRLHEYVVDLNLMLKPSPQFTVVPSVRVQMEDADADLTGFETLGANPVTSFRGGSDRETLDVRERLDLTYTGITNWVLYARAELTEGEGNLEENGGLGPVNGTGVSPIQRKTDDSRFFQKYSAGARWYPARRVIIDAGGYYKLNSYDYDHSRDSTVNNSFDRYPAYLVMQDFETYDGNVRLTLRPLQNVSLVSRYEFQLSTIHTKPDSISGLGEVESSEMTSHILAQDVSWSPWSRLNLQAGLNYVLSETKTPASDYTRAILNAQNNYWTVNFSSTVVLDDKSDLNIGYFYYQADNYEDNSAFGVPLGAGADEHGVTATLIRRISKNLRLSLKYGYFHYNEAAFGGNRDYHAHLLYSSLRYRF